MEERKIRTKISNIIGGSRFGKISPDLANFKKFWTLIHYLKNLKPILPNIFAIGKIFFVVNGYLNIE